MTRVEFWKIIETGAVETDLEQRNNRLVELLSTYSADDIISFEIHLRQVLDELDHFQVVGLLQVIMGMITDDPYLYFRCWIISNAETFASTLLEDGDAILEKLNYNDLPLFEDLLYVATLAYGNKMNKEEDESFPRTIAETKGLSYDLNAANTKGKKIAKPQLVKRFPNLWQLCRIAPPEGSAFAILKIGGFYSGPSFS